jgi:hypothetical protein
MTVRNTGTIWSVGDNETDMSMGLCAARVAMAANMEANVAIELLVKGTARHAYALRQPQARTPQRF